jgi:hypothetical protein
MHAKGDLGNHTEIIPKEKRKASSSSFAAVPAPFKRAEPARRGRVAKVAAEFMAQGVPKELAFARAELQCLSKKRAKIKA